MAAWSEIKARLIVLLGNRYQQLGSNADANLIAWWNQAQLNFAIRHTAPQAVASYDGDETTREFDLPADFLKDYAVYWNDGGKEHFLEPKNFKPGIDWDLEATTDTHRPYGYILWPADKLTVFHAPEVGVGNLRLYYFGLYADVVGDTSVLEPPVWAHEALLFYTLALSLVPEFQDTAAIRQWNQRIDSGRPVDNPLLQAFDALLKQYHESLTLWPKQVRDQYYYPGGRDT
jgi:hypothetical protein